MYLKNIFHYRFQFFYVYQGRVNRSISSPFIWDSAGDRNLHRARQHQRTRKMVFVQNIAITSLELHALGQNRSNIFEILSSAKAKVPVCTAWTDVPRIPRIGHEWVLRLNISYDKWKLKEAVGIKPYVEIAKCRWGFPEFDALNLIGLTTLVAHFTWVVTYSA